jgi:hypothetical protein
MEHWETRGRLIVNELRECLDALEAAIDLRELFEDTSREVACCSSGFESD